MIKHITKTPSCQLDLPLETPLDFLWREARNNGNTELMEFIEELKFKQLQKQSEKWLERQIKKSEGGFSV